MVIQFSHLPEIRMSLTFVVYIYTKFKYKINLHFQL